MPTKPTSKTKTHAAANNVIAFPQGRTATVAELADPLPGAINRNEKTSIDALTAYVAHNQKVSEDIVRAVVTSEFDVNDVASLRRADYERAIRFLVDLQIDLLIN